MRLLFFLSVLMLLVCSCRTQKDAQTEYVYVDRTDTLTLTRWRTDSIHVIDSVATVIKGDTVTIDRWHTKYVERLRTDTVNHVQTETVIEEKTLTVEVNRLKWWQTALMWAGVAATLSAVAVGAWELLKHRFK